MRINCILAHMKYIPNLLTLLNAVSGCIALYFVGSLELETAMYFVLLGAFFDLFDGLLARSFGVDGPLGTQLDSLADLITFGVVPGAVAVVSLSHTSLDPYLSLLGFAITIGSVYTRMDMIGGRGVLSPFPKLHKWPAKVMRPPSKII